MSEIQKIKTELFSESYDFTLTGREIRSFYLCKRQFYYRQVNTPIRNYNQHLLQGISTEENSYKRQSSDTEIIDSMILPDFLKNSKIVEVKDAKKIREADELQLKYYMWYINEKFGFDYDGELRLRNQNESKEIQYSKEVKMEVEAILTEVYEFISQSSLPVFSEKPICDNCMYKDLCWSNIENDKNDNK